MGQFYRNLGNSEVERLARAIAKKRGFGPDDTTRETGYPDAPMIPVWWKFQDRALDYLAMKEADEAPR